MKSKIFFLIAFGLIVLHSSNVFAQEASSIALSKKQIEKIILRVADTYEKNYVFDTVGKKMSDFIIQKNNNSEYDTIVSLEKLISVLTSDLQSVSNDKHIRIYPYKQLSEEDSLKLQIAELQKLKKENFGFRSLEILPGNIGYINIFQFENPKYASTTAIAAMNFLSNCDAVIIDLRENGGGYTTMRQLILSYFFDKPTHLATYVFRNGKSEQEWTFPYFFENKMTNIPVYILISSLTFSAAEGLAYCMQSQNKATIIGEISRGGAHPVEYFNFPEEKITIRVPYGRAINPITKTNWEGTGVIPDIQVSAFDNAYIAANIEALTYLLTMESEESSKYLLEWALSDYNSQLNPVVLDIDSLTKYIGNYQKDIITYENGRLYYQMNNNNKEEIIPMGSDSFKIFDKSGYSKYRIQFIRDENGKISGLYIYDHDGDSYPVKNLN